MSNTGSTHQFSNKQDQALIMANGVSKSFVTASGSVDVLSGIDLRVEQGEYIAITGKSGSGKSTLLNILTAIDRPTTGDVIISDTALHLLDESQAAVWRRTNVGIIFQFFQLLPTLSVIDNIMLPMDFADILPAPQREKRAMELLDRVGMVAHAGKIPTALSGGEQQRIAIARALANDPPLIVADEPTGNLDTETGASIIDLFRELVDSGKTLIVVTHENPLNMKCSRVITLSDGKTVKPGASTHD